MAVKFKYIVLLIELLIIWRNFDSIYISDFDLPSNSHKKILYQINFFPPDKLESFLSHHHAASDRKQIFETSNPLYVAAANLILKKEWDELEEKHYIQKKMTFCYNNGNNWL